MAAASWHSVTRNRKIVTYRISAAVAHSYIVVYILFENRKFYRIFISGSRIPSSASSSFISVESSMAVQQMCRRGAIVID